MHPPNFYKVLGISEGATTYEIKSAFRKLTLKYHPDRNLGDEEAVEILSTIHRAYEVLSDPEKRKEYDSKCKGNIVVSQKISGRTLIDRDKISISVDKRVVILGEVVQVLITIHENNNRIIVNGLNRFDVVQGPVISSLFPPGPDSPEVEIAYILKAKDVGYIEIGPASFVLSGARYLTESIFIKVNPPADLVRFRPASRLERIQSGVAGTLIVFYLFLIGYNIYQFTIFPLLRDYDTPYTNPAPLSLGDIRLSAGDSPYHNFYGKGKYDLSILNQIAFRNNKFHDAAVLLNDLHSKKPVRNNYIRSGEDFTMKHIPDGMYYLKVLFGNDWNDTLPVLNNKDIVGGFNRNMRYEIFSQQINVIQMQHSVSGDTLDYKVYEITLYPVQDGNAESVAVNAHEFFIDPLGIVNI